MCVSALPACRFEKKTNICFAKSSDFAGLSPEESIYITKENKPFFQIDQFMKCK